MIILLLPSANQLYIFRPEVYKHRLTVKVLHTFGLHLYSMHFH